MASMHLVSRIHHRRPNPTCSRSRLVARTACPQVYDPAPDLPQHHPTLPAQASSELPNGNEILPRVASSALERR